MLMSVPVVTGVHVITFVVIQKEAIDVLVDLDFTCIVMADLVSVSFNELPWGESKEGRIGAQTLSLSKRKIEGGNL